MDLEIVILNEVSQTKRKMDKEVVVLMYNGISLSHEIHVIRLVAAR